MLYRLTKGLGLSLAAVVLAAACATAPPAPAPRPPAEHLPAGADMYLGADLTRHYEFVLAVFEEAEQLSPELRRILDRTRHLTIAMQTLPDGRLSGLYVAGRGDYPVRTYETGLRFMRDWQRQETRVNGQRYSYWQNRVDGSQLMFLDNTTMLYAADGIELMIDPPPAATAVSTVSHDSFRTPVALRSQGGEATPHPLVMEEVLDRGMGLFVPEPSRRFMQAMPDPRLRVPVVELVLYLSEPGGSMLGTEGPDEGDGLGLPELELSGAVRLEREQDARVFTVIARLAVIGVATEAGIPVRRLLETLDIRRDGSVIGFRGIPVGEEVLVRRLAAPFRTPVEEPVP